MEAKLTELITFPMKAKYDLVKRTLPLTIIRPAESFVRGDAEDGSDEQDLMRNPRLMQEVFPTGLAKKSLQTRGALQVPGGLLLDKALQVRGERSSRRSRCERRCRDNKEALLQEGCHRPNLRVRRA